MNRFRKYFIVGSIVWSLFILSVTILPASELPSVSIKGIDKAVHFFLFFGFGFMVHGALSNGKQFKYFLLILLMSILYGISVEWLQQFIPGRTVDTLDMLSNISGALAGMILFRIASNKFEN